MTLSVSLSVGGGRKGNPQQEKLINLVASVLIWVCWFVETNVMLREFVIAFVTRGGLDQFVATGPMCIEQSTLGYSIIRIRAQRSAMPLAKSSRRQLSVFGQSCVPPARLNQQVCANVIGTVAVAAPSCLLRQACMYISA